MLFLRNHNSSTPFFILWIFMRFKSLKFNICSFLKTQFSSYCKNTLGLIIGKSTKSNELQIIDSIKMHGKAFILRQLALAQIFSRETDQSLNVAEALLIMLLLIICACRHCCMQFCFKITSAFVKKVAIVCIHQPLK